MPENDQESRNFLYYVVVNAEEQYALWPAMQSLPAGWHTVGDAAEREHCLAWIDAHWPDIRPLSVRQRLSTQSAPQGKGR